MLRRSRRAGATVTLILASALLAACGKAISPAIADTAITTRVKTAILNDPSIGGLGIELIILAVPAQAAQQIADRAVGVGIKGILNFAPIRLKVPSHVAVEDVNLVMQLEALSFAITQRGAGIRVEPGFEP